MIGQVLMVLLGWRFSRRFLYELVEESSRERTWRLLPTPSSAAPLPSTPMGPDRRRSESPRSVAGRPDPEAFALPSAAPPRGARVLAVAAIVIAGICGGLIGFGIADLSVSGEEGASATGGGGAGPALAALVGAVLAAGGVAVVAVLVLRAMTEWHTIEERARAAGGPPPRRHRRDRRS